MCVVFVWVFRVFVGICLFVLLFVLFFCFFVVVFFCLLLKYYKLNTADVDIDECAANPCANNGTCTQGNPGQFFCSCQPGYTGENCTEGTLQTQVSFLLSFFLSYLPIYLLTDLLTEGTLQTQV